jgi:protein SCO1/2
MCRQPFGVHPLVRAALAVVTAWLLAACGSSAPTFHSIDVTGANYGHDFRLTDPDGRERTLADFRGKVVMIYFGFIQCPDVCPTALSRAVEVRRLLGADADRLQLLFITVDPERDTGDILKAYTAEFDPSFLGLSASLEGTREVAEQFRVFFRKVPTGDSYTMDHGTTSYVFDPAGRLRLAVAHAQTAQSIAADVKTLLQDPKS